MSTVSVKRVKVIFFILLMIFSVEAGIVRTLKMDNKKAEAIYLCLGRSTVLRFREPPQKIVTGNKNYFSFEFLGNDIAIQPKGKIESNLFVYGEHERYTFNLKFLSGCRYDDLVKVFPAKIKNKDRRKILKIGDILKAVLYPPRLLAGSRDLWAIDFFLSHLGQIPVNLQEMKLKLNDKLQRFVIEKDFLKPEKIIRGRIIFNGGETETLKLTVEFKKEKAHTFLSWRKP